MSPSGPWLLLKGLLTSRSCTIYAMRGAQNFFWHGGWDPQLPTKGITNIQPTRTSTMRRRSICEQCCIKQHTVSWEKITQPATNTNKMTDDIFNPNKRMREAWAPPNKQLQRIKARALRIPTVLIPNFFLRRGSSEFGVRSSGVGFIKINYFRGT